MKRMNFLAIFLILLALGIAMAILAQDSTWRRHNAEQQTVHTVPCRWDDVCNGVMSPARAEALKHKMEEAP